MSEEEGAPITITGSVGQNGINQSPDVRAIQEALNSIPPRQGGPATPLKVDGGSGPFTIKAILDFQKFHRLPQPDGRVDVAQATLAKLNQVVDEAPANKGKKKKRRPAQFELPDPSLMAKILALEPQVREAIRAADAACVSLEPHIDGGPMRRVPGMTPISRSAMTKMDFCFSLSKVPSARPLFDNIRLVYANMRGALNRTFRTEPALAATLFVPNTDKQQGEEALAYTSAGGAFKGPERRLKNLGTPANRIYICNILGNQGRTLQIGTLVHELAHYVSGRPIKIRDPIDDGDIFSPVDFPRFQALRPDEKVRSADNYALFAMLCAGIGRFDTLQPSQ